MTEVSEISHVNLRAPVIRDCVILLKGEKFGSRQRLSFTYLLETEYQRVYTYHFEFSIFERDFRNSSK